MKELLKESFPGNDFLQRTWSALQRLGKLLAFLRCIQKPRWYLGHLEKNTYIILTLEKWSISSRKGNKVSKALEIEKRRHLFIPDKAPQKTFCLLVILSAMNLIAISCSRCELQHSVIGRGAVVSALRFLRGCWHHSCKLFQNQRHWGPGPRVSWETKVTFSCCLLKIILTHWMMGHWSFHSQKRMKK